MQAVNSRAESYAYTVRSDGLEDMSLNGLSVEA